MQLLSLSVMRRCDRRFAQAYVLRPDQPSSFPRSTRGDLKKGAIMYVKDEHS